MRNRIFIPVIKVLQENFVRILHIAGKVVQNFVCGMNSLSEPSIQKAPTFPSLSSKTFRTCMDASSKSVS